MNIAAPTTMRALVGGVGPEWQLDRHTPVPDAPPGVVRVRVIGAGINRADLYKLRGEYGLNPAAGRYSAGMEFAGVIDIAGPDTVAPPAGTRVMGVALGAFADYALTLPGLFLPIPDNMSFTSAAALPTGLITEHDALVTQGGFTAGQSVLVIGGTTVVGLVGVQLARAMGASAVIATTTSDTKRALLNRAGATAIVNTASENLAGTVLEATNGRGADITLDHLGGEVFHHLPAATAIGGIIVNIGRLAGRNATVDLDEVSFRRQRIHGTTFSVRTPAEIIDVVTALHPDATAAVASGDITVPVDSTFAPEDYLEAANRLRHNNSTGKVVFTFGDSPTAT